MTNQAVCNDNSFGIPESIYVNSKYHRPVPAMMTSTDAVISSPELFRSVQTQSEVKREIMLSLVKYQVDGKSS